MTKQAPRPLKNITADDLRPLWSRLDIPTRRIADALGVTRAGLSNKALSLGLPSRKGNQECRKLVSDARFAELWNAGVSVKDIHAACGYSSGSNHGAITARRRMLGLPPRTRGKNTGNHAGWEQTISMNQFLQMELGRKMAASSGCEEWRERHE